MTLEQPLWQQNNSYPARVDRTLIDETYTEGVLRPGGGALLVRERAAGAAMQIEIDPGACVIEGDDQAGQGKYLCRSTAVVSREIAAADPSNDRIDLVYAQVRDSNVTGSDDDWIVDVLAGTPGGDPDPPALPNTAIPLAEVTVEANASSIVVDDITDLREAAQVRSLADPVLGYAEVTAPQTGISDSETDLTGLAVTVDVPAGRRVRVSCHTPWVRASGAASDTRVRLTIAEGATIFQIATSASSLPTGTGSSMPLAPSVVLTPSTGSHTYKLTAIRHFGSDTVVMSATSERAAYILVEDIGPA